MTHYIDARTKDDVIITNGAVEPLTPITDAQRAALERVFAVQSIGDHMTWLDFRRSVQPVIGCDGAVMVYSPAANCWLGIEPDGYTHT